MIGDFSNQKLVEKEAISALVEHCCWPFPCPVPAALYILLGKQMGIILSHQCTKQCIRRTLYVSMYMYQCNWHWTPSLKKIITPWASSSLPRDNCRLRFWNNYSIVWSDEQATRKHFPKSCFRSVFLKIGKKTTHKYPIGFLLYRSNHWFRRATLRYLSRNLLYSLYSLSIQTHCLF